MTVNDFPWRIAAIKVKFYTIRTSYFGLVSGVSFTLRFVNKIRYKLSMDTHRKPIAHRIEWLMQHARQYSQLFSSSAATIERQRYLAEHPSAIAALKCMDGRINLSVDTHTPAGIIQPFRNLGGMFDLGWPHLGEVLANYVHTVVSRGQRVLLLITYHYFQRRQAPRVRRVQLRYPGGTRLHVHHPQVILLPCSPR